MRHESNYMFYTSRPSKMQRATLTLPHVPSDQEASDFPSMNTASESSVQASFIPPA